MWENLQKNKSVGAKWNLDNIKDGFLYFFEKHGRYPNGKEVDSFEYLPTRRTLERSFGGIVEVRKKLGLTGPLDYRTGSLRSSIASEADKRAKKYEEEFFLFLTSKVPELRVHEHKIIRPAYTAVDFFVYTSENSGVAIDLFYAMDVHSLVGIINIKCKKYLRVQFPVYFVLVGNENINQELINAKIDNRKNKLPNHIRVLTEQVFKEKFDNFLKN